MKIKNIPYAIDRRYLFIVVYLLMNAVVNVFGAWFVEWHFSLGKNNQDISAAGVLFSIPPLIFFAFIAMLISNFS